MAAANAQSSKVDKRLEEESQPVAEEVSYEHQKGYYYYYFFFLEAFKRCKTNYNVVYIWYIYIYIYIKNLKKNVCVRFLLPDDFFFFFFFFF